LAEQKEYNIVSLLTELRNKGDRDPVLVSYGYKVAAKAIEIAYND